VAANHPLTLAFILESGTSGDPGGRRRRGDRGGQAAGVPGRLQPEIRLGRRCHRRGSHRLGGSGRAGLPGAAPGRHRLGRRHARADPLVLHRLHHVSDPRAPGSRSVSRRSAAPVLRGGAGRHSFEGAPITQRRPRSKSHCCERREAFKASEYRWSTTTDRRICRSESTDRRPEADSESCRPGSPRTAPGTCRRSGAGRRTCRRAPTASW
jgi:hypothetical protein